MKKRIFVLLLSLILVLCFVTITVLATEENETVPTLKIETFNLSLQDAIYINCKVSSENISDVKNIKVLVWESLPEAYTMENNPAYTLETLGTDQETGYEVFRYTNLKAKDLTKVVYFCACYEGNDGSIIYSAPQKYSVLTYAYNKINGGTTDANLIALCKDILDYGASAQTYLGYQTDFLANSTVYKISVENGKLADGFTSGIYQSGTKNIVLTANAPEEGYEFSRWENGAGTTVGTETTLEVDVNVAETYTAVYKVIGAPSEGLTYQISGDSTYYIVTGIGDCKDVNLVIPSEYENLPVKEIADRAFIANKDLKSVKISEGITVVGVDAFQHCSNVKTLELADSITTVRARAFEGCNQLTSLTLPSSLTTWEKGAFAQLESVEGIVKIPDGITNIAEAVFYGIFKVDGVVIPKNVTTIASYAFAFAFDLDAVYYEGTEEDWNKIAISDVGSTNLGYSGTNDLENNQFLKNATRYYYSETKPTTEGNFWHYDENGEIAIW